MGITRIPPGFILLEEMLEMTGVTFLVWSGFALARAEGLLAFLAHEDEVEYRKTA